MVENDCIKDLTEEEKFINQLEAEVSDQPEITLEKLENLMQVSTKAESLTKSMEEMESKMENFLKNQNIMDETWTAKSDDEKLNSLNNFAENMVSMTKMMSDSQDLAMEPQNITVLDTEMNSLMTLQNDVELQKNVERMKKMKENTQTVLKTMATALETMKDSETIKTEGMIAKKISPSLKNITVGQTFIQFIGKRRRSSKEIFKFN